MNLADLIVEHGPYAAGGLIPEPMRFPTAAAMNELRDELIELRAIVAKAESTKSSWCHCVEQGYPGPHRRSEGCEVGA